MNRWSVDRLERPALHASEAVTLAAPLVFALVVVVPIAVTVGRSLGIGTVLMALTTLGTTGLLYLVFVTLRGQLLAGAYVALLVLSTFAANVPVPGSIQLRMVAPGSLGPQVWLYQAPLLFLCGYLLYRRSGSTGKLVMTELLLGGFVAYSLVAAVFGAGPRTDVALYFTWLMFQAVLVLLVVRRGVTREIVSLESVVGAYATALVGHLIFGVVQIFNQFPLGMSILGESINWNPVSYPPGVDSILAPSGLTGGPHVLVALVLLCFPPLFWFAYRSDAVPRAAALGAALLAVVVLRLTTSDSGRGAYFLVIASLLTGGVLLLWYSTRNAASPVETVRQSVERIASNAPMSVVGLIVGVLVVLYPSSASGSTSDRGLGGRTGGGTTGAGTTTSGTTGAGTATSGTTGAGTATSGTTGAGTATSGTTGAGTPGGEPIRNLSVPLFDLTNLGTRLQQYVVGLDVFRRNPLFGVGGGNFRFVAVRYGLPNTPSVPLPFPLHNVYLLLLAETGLPGFLLYMGAVVSVMIAGVRSCVSDNNTGLVLAVMSGFVGYMGLLFFTHLINRPMALLPFWAIGGAVVGEWVLRTRSTTEMG